MSKLEITLATWDYDRVRPIADIFPYGVAASRPTLEAAIRYSHEPNLSH